MDYPVKPGNDKGSIIYMNIHPFIFILISALSNATFNILLKVGLSKAPKAESLPAMFLMLVKSPYVWSGGVLFVIALLAYSTALQRINLSIAYPLLVSTVALSIITISIIFLDETLTPSKIAGIAFLLSGVWLLVR